MQRPGNYEKILKATQERELGEARRAIRGKPKSSAAPAADPQPDLDLRDIWRQPGGVPSYAAVTVTGPQPFVRSAYLDGEATGEQVRLDDTALRQMDDIPAADRARPPQPRLQDALQDR